MAWWVIEDGHLGQRKHRQVYYVAERPQWLADQGGWVVLMELADLEALLELR